MRSTVRLDDDLLRELKERANREETSMTKLLNRALREWLTGRRPDIEAKKRAYREKTFNTGKPLVDLTKALQLSAELEDEAIIEKLRQGR
ncbi:MAG: ribbon-helix-helix protein, CopG family [Pirellulales bacterium]